MSVKCAKSGARNDAKNDAKLKVEVNILVRRSYIPVNLTVDI